MLQLDRIENIDCLQLLKSMPDSCIDLILQDPPYNKTAHTWEYDLFASIEELWFEWLRVIKPNGAIVMTGVQPFVSKLISSGAKYFKYEWIWDKKIGVGFQCAKYRPMQQHEHILVFSKSTPKYRPQMVERPKVKESKISGNSKVCPLKYIDLGKSRKYTHWYPKSILQFSGADHSNILHPTQKPLKLFEYLINTYTDVGDTVFDGYCGSGTTAVAAKNLGRHYICAELLEEYYTIALTLVQEGE